MMEHWPVSYIASTGQAEYDYGSAVGKYVVSDGKSLSTAQTPQSCLAIKVLPTRI